jgi:uncharacterized protein YqjF (DUF2071 family)
LISGKGDPFLYADWERVVFLHYTIAPEFVRANVPASLELELFEGKACLSVVAVTMRRFRPICWNSPGWALRPIGKQSFLNFRTYVRHYDEPGALFLRGWLSRPMHLPLPSGMIGLPYSFAGVDFDHAPEEGVLCGSVRDTLNQESFRYRAAIADAANFNVCQRGSCAEFAMERYTGFFSRNDCQYVFRAWHPPWLQVPINLKIEDDSLVRKAFPWFEHAMFVGASFAPGFERVALGRAHRLPSFGGTHHRLSAFYEMP